MVEYVKIEKEQIDMLAEFASGIWFESWEAIITLGEIYCMANKFQSKISLTKQIEEQNYTYYFIKENDQYIGYFGIVPRERHLFLSNLYLIKDYRNKGYGRRTLEKVIEIAKEQNFKWIQLFANKQNYETILRFKKWGFKTYRSKQIPIGDYYVIKYYVMEYSVV